MKLTVAFFLLASVVSAQTNTFPSTGNVGIGTTSPAYPLDVVGAANDWKGRFSGSDGYIAIGPANDGWGHIYTDRPNFIFNKTVYTITGLFSSYSVADLRLQTNGITRISAVNATGNVGIGTIDPQERLDIRGNLVLETGTNPRLYTGTGSTELNRFLLVVNSNGLSSASGLKAGGLLVSDTYSYANPAKNDLVVKGNVGIGTPSPDAKLSVKGQIHAQEVKVDLNGAIAPDYVFDDEYELPSLEEIQSYINANKHLPEVPSGKEMEEKGINVGEMNLILLKKIEELTLHIIYQEERLQEQEKMILQMDIKLSQLLPKDGN